MSIDDTHAIGLVQQWRRTGDSGVLSDAITALRYLVAAAASRHRPDRQFEEILAGLLMARVEQSGAVADLDEVIRMMRRAAAETEGHGAALWLGRALFARFQRTDDQPDLREAIDALSRAAAAAPPGAPAYTVVMTDLLKVSWVPLDRSGDTAALTAAITTARKAIDLVPDGNPDKFPLALAISNALWHRSNRTQDAADVEQVIELCRGAMRAPSEDPAERARLLSLFGEALQARFGRRGDPADLDEAAVIGRLAVDTMTADQPRRARILFNLSRTLRSRFKHAGRLDDLREAISLAQQAVQEAEPDDPERYLYRAAFITELGERSEHAGDEGSAQEEIAGNRVVAESVPADDPHGQIFLANLGRLLFARYERSGDIADLDESVRTLRRAVAMPWTGDLFGSDAARVHLGIALVILFRRTNDIAALDEALDIGHTYALAAVRGADTGRETLTPILGAGDWRQPLMDRTDDTNARATLTAVLADALITRYEQVGDRTDLDDAITLATKSLDLLPVTDVQRRAEAMTSLGSIYVLRHLRSRDGADLDRAIESVVSVVAMLPPGDPSRPAALSNLAVVLVRAFAGSRNVADIDRAIHAAEEALESVPSDARGKRARALVSLSQALLVRYELAGAAEDLVRAVEFARQASMSTSDDDSDKSDAFYVLMKALHARHGRWRDDGDFAEAIDLARRVLRAEVVSPSRRLEIVDECASWAGRNGAWEQAAELSAACVDLLPRLASADRHPDTRQYWLSRWSPLTHRAAASALNAGDPQAAAVMLERGRGVLLSHTFDLRENLADLRAHDRDLAGRFEQLRRQLDDAPMLGSGAVPRLYTLDPAESAGKDFGRQRRRLLGQFGEILAEIRSRQGFEQYLRPAQWTDLIAQAGSGPVVMPNISEYRSDALIISADGVHVVELPHATLDALRHAVGSMYSAVTRSAAAWRRRDRDTQLRAQSEISSVLAWLWDAITEPVLQELDITAPAAPGRPWPRMWWVPTGQLSLLPLHAAQRGDQCALDRVISSYIPTVRALRVARGRAQAHRHRRILAVAMADTPDAPPLPFADREAVALAGSFGEVVTLSGQQATRERVRAEMPEHTWAHFACHGVSDPTDPAAGRLLLHDHQAHPFNIGEIAGLHLDNAELAYLSACETARSADGLADEAVHLGSAFQLAGYRHVVATLWTIRDDIGAELADGFYGRLLDEPGETAAALHHACRHVRQKFGNFPALWASHIHIGP